jgi:hypothetical protein
MIKSNGPMAPPAIRILVTTLCSFSWFFCACMIKSSFFVVLSYEQQDLSQAYTHRQLLSRVSSPVADTT